VFTGIIEELGRVGSITHGEAGARITVEARIVTTDARTGDSIAVNGVCLTVMDPRPDIFGADLSPETLERTTLGGLAAGSRVNLERAVTPVTRLGGHIVQGHVDSRGTFLGATDEGDFRTVRIGFPVEFRRYLVYKGSVAVEGISLTVAAIRDTAFDIAIIPKTWEMTDLSNLRPGDPVNLEADVIAKYVENMLHFGGDKT
jgi:riboflavin synthase